MKKIIITIVFIVVSLLIIINICSAMNIAFFGIRVFRIASGSMEPGLKINDLIIIKNSDNYNVNDIITFKDTNNMYITHRIIEINGDSITTKGDNNNTEDEPITKNDIVGKLVYKLGIPNFLNHLLLQPLFWGLIFVIGVCIIIINPTKKVKGKHMK